ncbi:MAG: hypothetical protein A2W93_15510 [Bacteroidetes bacterium GWF2_43_63]|nr:MAG: hypothetical protein A2W94_05280 [Bacteroidetes bacterium GWE2_42_42]OFY53426.1 MAG: hypothetical protein A2W93_15510 [Bacteroidetes bacterium GWF2_43_63]
MRHGKADGLIGGRKDIERPLTDLGRRRTGIIANELKKKKVLPQFIISSPAARALETAQHMAALLELDSKSMGINDDLYFKTVNDYFDALYALPDEYNNIMIVGHNPLITQFANFFLSQKIVDMPTSGLIALQSEARTWPEFVIAFKKALFYLIPKNLENEKTKP